MKTSKEELTDIPQEKNYSSHAIELQKSGFKLQLVEKLTEIDRRYKQGVLEYKENIQSYGIKIEKLNNKIALARESHDKEEKNLLMIEHELLFESRSYRKLQVKFDGYINSIEELQNEYKDVLDEGRYQSTLKQKERKVLELLDDLEVSELTLLNKELLRLNILEIFEPKEELLNSLEKALKELEREKAYFEFVGLDKVSTAQLENKIFWGQDNSEVVDTIEVDSDK